MSKEYDPFMHTAEHVVTQTMVRMFGCGRSFSSHLNADKSKCDYHFPRPLEDAEASELRRASWSISVGSRRILKAKRS